MHTLFNLDNPFFQFLARLADLAVLSLLCMFCCIPVITVGPAFSAISKVTQGLLRDELMGGVVSGFFKAFKDNLKQAMVLWLGAAVVLAALFCDFVLLKALVEGPLFTVLVVILFLLAVLVSAVLIYLFPLVARYENTLKEHIKNACILSILYLPRTVLLLLVHAAPLILALFLPDVLIYTLPFWVFLGCGVISYADSSVMKPIFDKLEEH